MRRSDSAPIWVLALVVATGLLGSRVTAQRVLAPALATLTAIRTDALPDVFRVTLGLGREATYIEDRTNEHLTLDLYDAQAIEALRDATVAFQDEIVRQVRVAGQPGNRTRLIFDLQGQTRHSVYALYNPPRVVIDFERAAPGLPAPLLTITPPPPRTSSAPAATPARRVPAAPHPAAPSAATANAAGGFSLSRQLGLAVTRVVIDPGHGGHDPGAHINGLDEATVVLDIALQLERLLRMEPTVEVVLTRRTDAFVGLEERTALANRAGADLFLSIHVNASADQTARGVETYFLNFASTPAAEALAARENAGSAQRMASLPDIVKAIALNNKIDESRDFASKVHRALHERLRKTDSRARNLGVKQAPFMVLVGATMPSVLVEISFLTNRNEAILLRSPAYRRHAAEALLAGIMDYQRSLKKTPAQASTF